MFSNFWIMLNDCIAEGWDTGEADYDTNRQRLLIQMSKKSRYKLNWLTFLQLCP
jgi:hypothetical protein